MLAPSHYHHRSKDITYSFSLLIPSWNNLEFLKCCVESILKHSAEPIQIIVIVNEGKDGSIDWIEKQEGIDYVHAEENVGICYGLNLARALVKADYMVYANDDMYFLPGWDRSLKKEIKSIGHDAFMLSCTMIEPSESGNNCVVVKDFGSDLASFQEAQLLKTYTSLQIQDWSGSTWPPNVVHKRYWDLVGGLSIEFSPGMYSDPDFSRKLYEAGVRIFKGKGDSLVYHFGSKSTRRVKRNKGRITFLMKWGISSSTFMKKVLHIGMSYQEPAGDIQLNILTTIINKLKRLRHSL